jgi:tRNA modification GTPase
MDTEYIIDNLRVAIERNIENNGGYMLDEYKYSITGQDCHDIRNLIKYDFISAKDDEHIEKLKKDIAFFGRDLKVGENEVLVTNLRHYEALIKAAESLVKVKEGLDMGISTEFVAQDLKEVLYYLGSITGEISSGDVLNNIFGRFCIGK